MGLLLWIIFGMLVGLLVSLIVDDDPDQDTLKNIGLGIIGSVVGGYIIYLMGADTEELNVLNVLVAGFGAIIAIGGKYIIFYMYRL